MGKADVNTAVCDWGSARGVDKVCIPWWLLPGSGMMPQNLLVRPTTLDVPLAIWALLFKDLRCEWHGACSVSQNYMGSGVRLATCISTSLSLHLPVCKMSRGAIFYPVGSLWGSMQRIVFDSVKRLCTFHKNAKYSSNKSKKNFWKSNFILNLGKRAYDLKQWFSVLHVHHHHQESFLKSKLLSPTPRVTISVGQDGAWESASQTSSQVMLMLLVSGPHFEKHVPQGISSFSSIEESFLFYLYFLPLNFYFHTWNFYVWISFKKESFSASGAWVNWTRLRDFALLIIFTHLCGSMSVRTDISDSLFVPNCSSSTQPVLMSHVLPTDPSHDRRHILIQGSKIWLLPRLEKENLFELFS